MTMTPSIEVDLPGLVAKGSAFEVSTSIVETPSMQPDNESAGLPVPTVEAFRNALARPVAENAELQHALESIVGQLSRTTFAETVPFTEIVDVPRQAVAPTVQVAVPPAVVVPTADEVQQKETPPVGVAACRVEPSLALPATENVTRQAPASTNAPSPAVPVADVASVAETAPVDAAARRVEPSLTLPATEDVPRQAAASTVSAAVVMPPASVVPQEEDPLVDVATRRVEGRSVLEEVDPGDAVVAAGIRPALEGLVPVAPQEVATSPDAITAVDSVKAAFAPTEVLPTETFFEVANAVADVLLVSPGLLRGEGEMRVQLKPDVLEGSEICISVTGRQLAIQFTPRTSDVAVLIEQNRPQLEQHLAARFQTFALVVGVRRRRTDEVKGSSVG